MFAEVFVHAMDATHYRTVLDTAGDPKSGSVDKNITSSKRVGSPSVKHDLTGPLPAGISLSG